LTDQEYEAILRASRARIKAEKKQGPGPVSRWFDGPKTDDVEAFKEGAKFELIV
jgi:hypothetical protein